MASSQKYDADIVIIDKSLFKENEEDKSAQLIDLARLAEAAERYSDMAVYMKDLVEMKIQGTPQKLDVEQRNLFSVAYKNVIGAVRSSWRTVTSGQFTEVDAETLEAYKKAIEAKMQAICNEVLTLLEDGTKDIQMGTETIKAASGTSGLLTYWTNVKPTEAIEGDKGKEGENKEDNEARIFYLKMCGDYYRYLAEFNSAEENKRGAECAYTNAMELAKTTLPETHPTRLGLALNFSVCYYEILKKPQDACKLAKEAFDAAIEKLDTLNDASYKDSTLIMQLLRDNLTLWTSEENESGGQ